MYVVFSTDLHQRCEVVAQRMRSQTRWSIKRNRGRTNSEPRNVATRNVVEGDAQSNKKQNAPFEYLDN